MNVRTQTDTWIYCIAIVLGFILLTSVAGIIILLFVRHSMPEILVTLGMISGAGLAKLSISPLNRELLI